MITVTAKEAKNRLGEYMMEAMREPVAITHHGKPFVFLVANRDFGRAQGGFFQADLDAMKHRLSCEVVARFTLKEIRRRSLANLKRWKSKGVSSPAYIQWTELLRAGSDQKLLTAMLGLGEESNRLRQSLPYVGLLDQKTVEALREIRQP